MFAEIKVDKPKGDPLHHLNFNTHEIAIVSMAFSKCGISEVPIDPLTCLMEIDLCIFERIVLIPQGKNA